MSDLVRPRALLLDFGGVVVETRRRETWADDMSAEIHRQLTAAGTTSLTIDDVRVDLLAGCAADSAWKNAMSRPFAPAEMTHRRFWGDFVAADWPRAARELVLAHATPLSKLLGELRSDRAVRPALEKVLDAADDRGIVVGIASNALSGAVHRDFMEQVGLDSRFAVQVYSDEAGVRKPNPELIWIACRALDVEPADVWYVGDNFDRDVVCGRRAGTGGTILMEAKGTYDRPYAVREVADAVVPDPAGLLRLLEEAGA